MTTHTSKSIMAGTLQKIMELSTIQDMETKICRSMCGAIDIIVQVFYCSHMVVK